MANPGPAVTVSPQYCLVNAQQAVVLVAFAKQVPLSAVADNVLSVQGNIESFVPTVVVTCNSNGSVSSASLGVYTGLNSTGTAVLTAAALTGQVSPTFAYVRAATASTSTVTVGTQGNLYARVSVSTTTVASAVSDVYVYGYNVT